MAEVLLLNGAGLGLNETEIGVLKSCFLFYIGRLCFTKKSSRAVITGLTLAGKDLIDCLLSGYLVHYEANVKYVRHSSGDVSNLLKDVQFVQLRLGWPSMIAQIFKMLGHHSVAIAFKKIDF